MSGSVDPTFWVWSAVLIGGVLLLAVGLVMLRRASQVVHPATADGGTARPVGSALDVLDDRLARGEIDVTEYERRRAVLDEH